MLQVLRILCVDIGNSTIKLGLFDKNFFKKTYIDINNLSNIKGYRKKTLKLIENKDVEGCIISSVVPEYTKLYKSPLEEILYRPPLLVTHKIRTGLTFSVKEPEKVGTDRMVTSVAAYNYFKSSVAVVDFGTATTISIVDKKGRFIGGTIMPGINLMKDSLKEGTALLPLVELNKKITPIGKDTETNIASGIIIGTVGAVERIISEIEREIGQKLSIAVTGGNADLITPYMERSDLIDNDLSLKGLKILYEKNQSLEI